MKSTANIVLFDLDNTLYPAECGLFDMVDVRINAFMTDQAGIDEADVNHLRVKYWNDYGVTLQGLMRHHGVNPEEYLNYVHDVDVRSRVRPDPELRRMLEEMPQQKVIFTNGCRVHVDRVLAALEIEGLFDAVFDIRVADYQPKPCLEPYQKVLQQLAVDPEDCLMVEDSLANLRTAKQMGMTTLLVGPPVDDAHVDHRFERVAQAAEVLV